MTTATLYLPWPNKVLSPNARVHWSVLAKAKKKAKSDAYFIARAAGLHGIKTSAVTVQYTFFPPDRHARDDDNLVGSMKAFRDGIASAMGVDDRHWTVSHRFAGEIKMHGMVKVELEWSDADEKAA